jgi:hypothetical protein
MEIPVFEDSSPVHFLAISLGTSLQVYYWSLGKLVLKKLNRLRFDPSWVPRVSQCCCGGNRKTCDAEPSRIEVEPLYCRIS